MGRVLSAAVDALPDMLGRLKLRALRDRLDGLLEDAARQDLNLREALALLCDAEMRHREERRIHMAMNIAKFPFVRTLEGFDFEAQPSLDPKQIRELAACRWVANGDALLILGPPGVGKSHLAVALGREAIRHGYSVLFIPAIGLITVLAKAHADGKLDEKRRHNRAGRLPALSGQPGRINVWGGWPLYRPKQQAFQLCELSPGQTGYLIRSSVREREPVSDATGIALLKRH